MMQKCTTVTTIFRVKKCYFHYVFSCKRGPLSLRYAKKNVLIIIFFCPFSFYITYTVSVKQQLLRLELDERKKKQLSGADFNP
jgi:hypothetical protein